MRYFLLFFIIFIAKLATAQSVSINGDSSHFVLTGPSTAPSIAGKDSLLVKYKKLHPDERIVLVSGSNDFSISTEPSGVYCKIISIKPERRRGYFHFYVIYTGLRKQHDTLQNALLFYTYNVKTNETSCYDTLSLVYNSTKYKIEESTEINLYYEDPQVYYRDSVLHVIIPDREWYDSYCSIVNSDGVAHYHNLYPGDNILNVRSDDEFVRIFSNKYYYSASIKALK